MITYKPGIDISGLAQEHQARIREVGLQRWMDEVSTAPRAIAPQSRLRCECVSFSAAQRIGCSSAHMEKFFAKRLEQKAESSDTIEC
jgi:hypothetical protein